MLVIVAAVALASGMAVLNRRTPGKDIVPWRADYPTALAEAKETGKPAMLYFTAHWCGPCQEMRQYTWSDATLAATMKDKVVPVKLDLDANPDLAAKYDIRSIPAMLIVTADGREVRREVGYMSADEMVAWLKQ